MSNVSELQVYRIYIKASLDRVWEAITDSRWTERYSGMTTDAELHPGGRFRKLPGQAMQRHLRSLGIEPPETIFEGEVVTCEPPSRLVHTYSMTLPDMREGVTTVSWELVDAGDNVTRLTVTHELPDSPKLSLMLGGDMEDQGGGGGWPEVLSSLKSMLEGGEPLRG